MLNILDKYIFKIIFSNIFLTLFILTSLSSIIKFIEQLHKVGQGCYSILNAGTFTILNIFKDIETFFPIAVLFGSILGLSLLEIHGELLIMQVCGFNQKKIINSIIKISIILIIWTIISNEWIIPIGKQISHKYKTQAIFGKDISSVKCNLWIKDGNNFVFIEKSSQNKTELFNLNIYCLNNLNRIQSIIFAKKAIFDNKKWKLFKITIINLNKLNKISVSKKFKLQWKTNFTPDKLKIITLEPNNLSISKLYSLISFLKKNNQEYSNYQLIMMNKILSPVTIGIIMSTASLFTYISTNKITIRKRIIAGICLSFLFYILDKIINSFIILYNLSYMYSMFLPIASIICISFVFIKKNSKHLSSFNIVLHKNKL